MNKKFDGKTLLFLDGSSLAACAVIRAKEMGVKTIVANYYPPEKSPAKKIADEVWDVNFSDIDLMLRLIRENHVDGIFIGWTDSHLPIYNELCTKAGLPCCGTKEQFEILSNDKVAFKRMCMKYGVPTPELYEITPEFRAEDMAKIRYPVMVKPADESGGRGIMRCDTEDQLKAHYLDLYAASASKKIVCERYMSSENEIFIHYTVQNGEPSLSASFLKYKTNTEKSKAASCLFHMFSPKFLDLYVEQEEPAVIRMIKALGVQNGNLMFQGFEDGGKLYFHESGLRMGGEQFYVFAERLNGISSLELMIEFAITGKMTLFDAKKMDNYRFSQYCCNYYIALNSGTIASIAGVEEINQMPQVLQCRQFKFVNDEIKSTTSLDRVIFRLHVMDDTKEHFAKTLCKISDTLKILDENGKDMQFEHLEYDTVMNIINDAWPEDIR